LNISIPYGAIKRKESVVNNYFSIGFQFLMVRLKGGYEKRRGCSCVISIPYGAIKRRMYSKCNKNTYISIPYGAIKSTRGWLLYCWSKEFQFLMVRLKDFDLVDKTPSYLNFNSLWCD